LICDDRFARDNIVGLSNQEAYLASQAQVQIARDTHDDHRFLELLEKYDCQGRKMSHKVAANDYAPRVIAAEKNCISLKRFEQAMERLFEAKQIHAQSYGPPSKQRSRLVLGPLEAPQ
jgi:RecA-family ATPase